MLSIVPLPLGVKFFWPQWCVLALVYWLIALPVRSGLTAAWSIGILLDVLQGTLLGVHALAMVLIAYGVLKFHRQIRIFPLRQQMLTIFVIVQLFQLIILLEQGMLGEANFRWQYWLSGLSSMLIWPWVFVILRDYRCRFNLY